ncbi:MAG: aminotransferase class IV [Gammaproteobacteria bacterium]
MSGDAPRICYLDGQFLPLAEARVSVLDRGFIFGDAVYEVLVALKGRLFALEEHLERFARSLAAVHIAVPLDAAAWRAVLLRLVAENGGGDHSVYLQVTRGVAERDHAFPLNVAPTVFAMCRPLMPRDGLDRVDAVTLVDNRWLRCDIKATALLANLLLRNQALAAGAYEAVLLRDGEVTEGSSSNVFVVKDGRVWTPPLSHLILPGVTRALLLDVLEGCGIEVAEATVDEALLRAADEVWFTSTTRDLVAVTRLDGREVGNGTQPLAERAWREFQRYKELRLR